jgi:hypothetical protein
MDRAASHGDWSGFSSGEIGPPKIFTVLRSSKRTKRQTQEKKWFIEWDFFTTTKLARKKVVKKTFLMKKFLFFCEKIFF